MAAVLLCGCRQTSPVFDRARLRQPEVEPLWAMPVNSSGGCQVVGDRLRLANMLASELYPYELDLRNGRLLSTSKKKISRIKPASTPVEIGGGVVRSLVNRQVSWLPTGFEPAVVTDRLVIARRTWSMFYQHGLDMRFIGRAQIAVVDRVNQDVMWFAEIGSPSLAYSRSGVYICGDDGTLAFSLDGGRPAEVSRFYAAIAAGDVEGVRAGLPAWKQSGLDAVWSDDPVTAAARNGRVAVIRFLIGSGLSPDSTSAYNCTPLLAAIKRSHRDAVRALLDAGADPNRSSHEWGTPLIEAAQSNGRSIVDLLVRAGARLNVRSEWDGRTALHEAVSYRNYEAVGALLDFGINMSVRDDDGKTARELYWDEPRLDALFSSRPQR